MMIFIEIFTVLFSLLVFGWLVICFKKAPKENFDKKYSRKVIVTGVVANFADTIGLGSFAVIVAFDKFWKLLDDKKLPGTLNAQAIIPAMLESLFFVSTVQANPWTLFWLVLGTCIGGFSGGYIIARLNRQFIQLLMGTGFLAIAFLVLGNQLHWLPIGGDKLLLSGAYLVVGFIGMIVIGALPAVGIGVYAPTQAFLFLLGMSPIAAYPIMTTASALQQPLTAWAFLLKKEVAFKVAIYFATAGVIGVLLGVGIVTHINLYFLRWLLFAIVLYNAYMILKAYMSNRKR